MRGLVPRMTLEAASASEHHAWCVDHFGPLADAVVLLAVTLAAHGFPAHNMFPHVKKGGSLHPPYITSTIVLLDLDGTVDTLSALGSGCLSSLYCFLQHGCVSGEPASLSPVPDAVQGDFRLLER